MRGRQRNRSQIKKFTTDGTTDQDEEDADRWARDTLIAPEAFAKFKNNRDYSAACALAFAKEQEIAPGIVVGRMQREGIIKYSMLNNLKVQYEIQ